MKFKTLIVSALAALATLNVSAQETTAPEVKPDMSYWFIGVQGGLGVTRGEGSFGDLVIFVIFLMGGVLAGFAGMLYGMRFIVKPTIGLITNKSFVAAVFGGLGSLPGAILGSLLLGIMEIFVASWNSAYRDLFVYALLIIVLVVKPSGLMGKVTEDKA